MKKTGEIDRKLGKNIVSHRIAAGLSRKQLADAIGITHQQLQKYEKGINRITVARLYDIARELRQPVIKLLEADMPHEIADNRFMSDMAKYINKIKDRSKLDAIRNLVRTLSVGEAQEVKLPNKI